MSKLQQISETARHVAEAIASVLGIDVTITDDGLRRIAGTGCYVAEIGNVILEAQVYKKILQFGQGFIIDSPGKHNACMGCNSKDTCCDKALLCCPIKLDGKSIGIIALVALTPEQRQILLGQQHDLLGFVDRMADLLAGKVAEQERLTELKVMKNQLEAVINAVHEGIIAVDFNGQVVKLNAAAEKLMGIKTDEVMGMNINQLFPDTFLEEAMRLGKEVANREISCWLRGRRVHCIMTLTPWFDSEGVKGLVATLQGMKAVKEMVSHYNQNMVYTSDLILGSSEAIENAKKAVSMAARSNTTVLIRGESGTGKELFARALHYDSDRRHKPFIVINCAAIPEALLESELFGYDEGAFTGARRGGKPGKFELADGGTLFLDEIGDMSLQIQAKLLRVLQEKRIERVGGTESISVDVRIVSATHKDIEAMVKSGEFRQDIYYRINVFPLFIPPLRQRREDLPGLISYFLQKYPVALGKEITGIEDEAYKLLMAYDWPGNVRELENVMEYLVNIETSKIISAQNVSSRIQRNKKSVQDIIPLADVERQLIVAALAKFGTTLEGKTKAAEALGISKATLYRKLKEYSEP